MNGKSSIREYFTGKNIFITGGSGFMGKALIEKLLRSSPDLNKIYILVRPKKGKVLQERVDDIISSPLFSLLRKTRPENLNKIIPIAGDVKELKLGISNEDWQVLTDTVHVFFHAAASVKFNDFLKDAVFANLRSAREVALLALEMKQLEGFMHVSTTYCNTDNRKTVEEVLYPANGGWEDTIKIAENCDGHILDVLTHKYIGTFPNTYTYTKQLAEHCINDLLVGKVPTIIYRPSVVVATLADPYQGWVDNFNGPTGLLVAMATGLVRIVYCGRNIKTDYIPVDIVTKSIIVSLWYKINFGNNTKLDVYHGSTNGSLSIEMHQFIGIGKILIWNAYLGHSVWFPGGDLTSSWYNYYINVIVFHIIPALFMDLALQVAGRQPMIFKLQKKIYLAAIALEPYMFNEWRFINTKTLSLLDKIPKKEMYEFNFGIQAESKELINEYFTSGLLQTRLHLLKEDRITTEHAYIRQLKLYYLDKACRWIFYGLVIWLAFFKFNIVAGIWNIVINYLNSLP